jgi:hypothetical protein
MSMLEQVRLIIYRIKEKGLEVFLVNTGEHWDLPEMREAGPEQDPLMDRIELDPLEAGPEVPRQKALAIEGDWHDIPSLKKLLREDVDQLKDQLHRIAPELEQGSFFALPEALRRMAPDYNAFIRELKDILRDRNSIKYL